MSSSILQESRTLSDGRMRLRLLVLNVLSYLLTIVLLYQIAPFFPLYLKEANGPLVDDTIVGGIFAMLPLVSFLLSPFCGYLLQIWGHVNVICAGSVVLIVSTVMFGLTDPKSVHMFFVWRAVQGVGAAGIWSATTAVIARLFPNNTDSVYAIQETTGNIGFIIGPTMGGALYGLGGFACPFIVASVCHAVLAVSVYWIWTGLPKPHTSIHDDRVVGVLEVLRPRVVLTLLGCSLICGCWGFCDPVAAEHFVKVLGPLNPEVLGLLYAVPAIGVVCTAGFIPRLSKRISKSFTLALGMVCLGVGLLVFGPWFTVRPLLPSSMWCTQVFALVMLGFGSAFGWIPAMPHMLDQVYDMPPGAMDALSGLFNSLTCFGEAVGPIAGGWLTSKIGFESAAACYGITVLGYAVVFVVLSLRFPLRRVPHLDVPLLADVEHTPISHCQHLSLAVRGHQFLTVQSDH